MLRIVVFFLLLAKTLSALAGSTPAKFYDQRIYLQQTDDDLLQTAVADLQQCLQKATGKSFSVTSSATLKEEGIQLLLIRPGFFPSSQSRQLQNGTIEDFVIDGNANRLLLIANHPLGLTRAIYSYLDQLGFKWYLPGDEWAYTPSLAAITIATSRYITPFFTLRDFFGTGGIAPVKELDPGSLLQQKWNDWKRRNQAGGAFQLSGHYGDTFNGKYKIVLEQHPEYLALVNGIRVWSGNAKWCISNPKLRELFIADRVMELKQRLQRSKYSNEIIYVSVDPADGNGDCECDDCKKLGSVNDRIYLLANETTKALQKISPKGYANIYAYNTHAAPPPFQLSSNLLVQVVPYAFQTVSSPEQLIVSWRKQQSGLLLYDYYGIPDWQWDLPPTGYLSTSSYLQRIDYWKRQGVKGFMLETSYSLGCTGLGLYQAVRKGWIQNENTGTLMRSFYKQLFGTASNFIEAYFTKLASYSGSSDLPYLIMQVDGAAHATTDNKVQQRITLLKSYLHYLVMYYEYQPQLQNQDMLNKLIQYVIQIYPSGAVHSTYLTQLLARNISAGSPLTSQWNLYQPVGRSIKNIKFLNAIDIEYLFQQDVRKYPLLKGFPYLQKESRIVYTMPNNTAKGNEKNEGMILLEWPETFVRPGKDGTIRFFIKCREMMQGNKQQTISVQLLDKITGKEISNQQMTIVDSAWEKVILRAIKGKIYKLIIKNNTSWIQLKVPDIQWLAFADIPMYTVLGKLWFYLEKGNKFIYFSNITTDLPTIKNNGQKVLIEKVNDLGLYRVSTSASASLWWTIEGTEYKKLQFHNKNLLFFTQPNIQAH